MEGVGDLAFGQKFLEIYGPMGLGWVAWIFTMFYLRAERKRYQDLVILIVQYFTKVNMLEKPHESSPLDTFFGRGVSDRGQPQAGRADRESSGGIGGAG